MATTTPTMSLALTKVNTNSDGPLPGGNIFATNEQSRSVVIALSGTNGGYLVAWDEWNSALSGFEPRDVSARYFDVDGNPVGVDFLISFKYLDLNQSAASLSALPNGGFVAAYQTTDATFVFNDGENIDVAKFADNATLPNIQSDDYREGAVAVGNHDQTAPSITTFSDGSYLVAFETNETGDKNIVAHKVSAAGVRSGQISIASTGADESSPDLATLTGGNAAIVYTDGAAVQFKLVSSLGVVGTVGTVASGAGIVSDAEIAGLTGGGFVVVWNDSAGDGAANAGVRAQLFTSAGAPTGTVITVPTTTIGTQDQAAVTALADGGFLVAWHDASTKTVLGQRFDAAGTKVGTEFTVAAANNVSEPAMALLADGRVVVTITDNNAGNKDIYQVIVDPRDPVNQAPTAVVASNVRGPIAENTSTSSPIKFADLTVTDDALGTNALSLAGADASLFQILNGVLYLKAGATLDFETNPKLDVNVIVNDASVGGAIDAQTTLSFTVTNVNEAPTAIAASNVRGPIAENTSTTSPIKFADLTVTDDALGSNALSLAGADASLFQILNGVLYLKAGAKLDFETNPKLDVNVIVNDASVGGAIDAQTALSFSVTDVLERTYVGTSTSNTLIGNGSDETFIGGAGADKMTGGGGRDTFVFKALTDTVPGSPSFISNQTIAWQSGLGLRDVITDFTPGNDKIDLSLIDASTKLAGNQAFAFNGTGTFSSNPGSLIYRVFDLAGTANDRTIVYADVNGDRLADMQIELTGLKTLQATDFVL